MKIVILDANSLGGSLDLTIFEDFGELYSYGFTDENQLVERIKDVDVIITNKVTLDETNMKEAKQLKLICVTGTGTNNINKKHANELGITVSNVVNYSTESVAQHTFAMLFYLYEQLDYYDQYVKSGRYVNDEQFGHYEMQFNELYGKRWGIIGLGNIGKRVAEIASAFGSEVVYYSTTGRNNHSRYKKVDLKTLLKTSDIVSIHAPLNEQTKYLITYHQLKLMKKSAYLLNLGRGAIIDENDLAWAIEEGLIAGVGLDVLSEEPMSSDNPFISLKQNKHRLFITPHIGWASIESRNRVIQEVYKNIEAFIKGESRNVVKE